MITGYHGQPAKTAAALWHDPTGKRFIRTGDIGRFDADGFLVLLDRVYASALNFRSILS